MGTSVKTSEALRILSRSTDVDHDLAQVCVHLQALKQPRKATRITDRARMALPRGVDFASLLLPRRATRSGAARLKRFLAVNTMFFVAVILV